MQSLPRLKFPDSFSLSVNPSNFINTTESIKVIEEMLVLYVKEQRRSWKLLNQAALIIMDVFRGQITSEVLDIIRDHKIYLCKVSANMIHLF